MNRWGFPCLGPCCPCANSAVESKRVPDAYNHQQRCSPLLMIMMQVMMQEMMQMIMMQIMMQEKKYPAVQAERAAWWQISADLVAAAMPDQRRHPHETAERDALAVTLHPSGGLSDAENSSALRLYIKVR